MTVFLRICCLSVSDIRTNKTGKISIILDLRCNKEKQNREYFNYFRSRMHLFYGPWVPAGSPSRGGDVVVCVFDINQLNSPTPFYSVLVSISLFIAVSTVFHSINSPDNSPLSHSVLPILFLHYWSFQLYMSL